MWCHVMQKKNERHKKRSLNITWFNVKIEEKELVGWSGGGEHNTQRKENRKKMEKTNIKYQSISCALPFEQR